MIFHLSNLHGGDEQQAHAELLPSLMLNVVLITVQSLYESPQQKLRNFLAATVSRDMTTKRAPAS